MTPALRVMAEVRSEMNRTDEALGSDACEGDYAADVVIRLVRAYGLHSIAGALAADGPE